MLFIYINNKNFKHPVKYYLLKKLIKTLEGKSTHVQGNECDPRVSNGIMFTL